MVYIKYTITASDNSGESITPVCTPSSGSAFGEGDTEVTCTATDSSENEATATFTVTVSDITPPAFVGAANRTATLPSDSNMVVVDYDITATDKSGQPVTPDCDFPSGNIFGLGDTDVTCTATDSDGNIGTTTFTVTVIDVTPPVISNFDAIHGIFPFDDTTLRIPFDYDLPTASDNSGESITPVCTPSSGSNFGNGIAIITCTATDSSGNETIIEFAISLNKPLAPTFSDVRNIITTLPSNLNTVAVDYDITATDSSGDPIAHTCTPESGSQFELGFTRVQCNSFDNTVTASGEVSSIIFHVIVIDETPPELGSVTDLTIPLPSDSDMTVVKYNFAIRDNSGETMTPVCDHPSGSLFGLGTTMVTCTATDSSGNAATTTFNIIVIDDTPPVFSKVKDIRVAIPPGSTAITVTYDVTVSDNSGKPITTVCTPPSGSEFELGNTDVTCTATDSSGNYSTRVFTVIVMHAQMITSLQAAESISGKTSADITFTWDALPDIDEYTIRVLDVGTNTTESFTSLNASSTVTLAYDTDYTITVYPSDEDYRGQTIPYHVPKSVTGLAALVSSENRKDATVELTWNAFEGAQSYQINIRHDVADTTESFTTNSTAYTVTLRYNTDYTITVYPDMEESRATSISYLVPGSLTLEISDHTFVVDNTLQFIPLSSIPRTIEGTSFLLTTVSYALNDNNGHIASYATSCDVSGVNLICFWNEAAINNDDLSRVSFELIATVHDGTNTASDTAVITFIVPVKVELSDHFIVIDGTSIITPLSDIPITTNYDATIQYAINDTLGHISSFSDGCLIVGDNLDCQWRANAILNANRNNAKFDLIATAAAIGTIGNDTATITYNLPITGLDTKVNNRAGSTSNIEFTWDNLPGVGKYQIQVTRDGIIGFVLNTDVTGNSYTSGLANDRIFEVKVFPVNQPDRAQTITLNTSIPVTNLKAQIITIGDPTSQVEFTWNDLPRVSNYKIQITEDGVDGFIVDGTTSENSYQTYLTNDRTYTVKVFPANTPSRAQTITLYTGLPITNLAVELIGPDESRPRNEYKFTWDELSDVTTYILKRYNTGSGSSGNQQTTENTLTRYLPHDKIFEITVFPQGELGRGQTIVVDTTPLAAVLSDHSKTLVVSEIVPLPALSVTGAENYTATYQINDNNGHIADYGGCALSGDELTCNWDDSIASSGLSEVSFELIATITAETVTETGTATRITEDTATITFTIPPPLPASISATIQDVSIPANQTKVNLSEFDLTLSGTTLYTVAWQVTGDDVGTYFNYLFNNGQVTCLESTTECTHIDIATNDSPDASQTAEVRARISFDEYIGFVDVIATLTLIVPDTTIPVISGATDITRTLSSDATTIVVDYAITVTDNSGETIDPVCDFPSGSEFGLGTTLVTCTATDSSGNEATATFNVIVNDSGQSVTGLAGTTSSRADSTAQVEFTWDALDDVTEYTIIVLNTDSNTSESFTSTTSSYTISLLYDVNYTITVSPAGKSDKTQAIPYYVAGSITAELEDKTIIIENSIITPLSEFNLVVGNSITYDVQYTASSNGDDAYGSCNVVASDLSCEWNTGAIAGAGLSKVSIQLTADVTDGVLTATDTATITYAFPITADLQSRFFVINGDDAVIPLTDLILTVENSNDFTTQYTINDNNNHIANYATRCVTANDNLECEWNIASIVAVSLREVSFELMVTVTDADGVRMASDSDVMFYLLPITGLAGTVSSSGDSNVMVEFTWDAYSGISEYEIIIDRDAADPIVFTSSTTSYTATLLYDTDYTITVRPADDGLRGQTISVIYTR